MRHPLIVFHIIVFNLFSVYACNKKTDERVDSGIYRKGFGEVGEHGERRISFLSRPSCGMSVYDEKVVYIDAVGKVFIIDLENEIEYMESSSFLDGTQSACRPSIWEDNIVFEAVDKNEVLNIAVYNITSGNGYWLAGDNKKRAPKIYKNIIVWQDYREFTLSHVDPEKVENIEIYYMNLSNMTEIRVTNEKYQQLSASIYEDRIVWEDLRELNNRDIYMYTISTGTTDKITQNSSDQWAPRISNNYVVWMDLRNGQGSASMPYWNSDIYAYNLLTKEIIQITSNESDQEHPNVFGKYIVWNDLRDGGRENNGYPYGANVYLYNIEEGVEKKVTWSNSNDGGAYITKGKVIWYSTRDGEEALYMKELSEL